MNDGHIRIFHTCKNSELTRLHYEMKGYISEVVVQIANGHYYRLIFYTPLRLQQNIECSFRSGELYFAEEGLVIIPEATFEAVKAALPGLVKEGFFKRLVPINEEVVKEKYIAFE